MADARDILGLESKDGSASKPVRSSCAWKLKLDPVLFTPDKNMIMR